MSINEPNINLDTSQKEVIANKPKLITSAEIYNRIYSNQLLEIFKLSVSFLISKILYILLQKVLLNYYEQNTILYIILLIALLVFVVLLTVGVSTYLKIINEKNEFLNKIITQQNGNGNGNK